MITEDDVKAAYRLLLDREPESEEVVASLIVRAGSLAGLRDILLTREEFLDRSMRPLGRYRVSQYWPVRGEPSVMFQDRLNGGFFASYMSGHVIVNVGFRGDRPDAVPILPHAIGVDFGYPGYDGRTLPFPDESVDTVFSSHTLEHIPDYVETICDWYRVTKVNGFVVCIVPHQFLYEKRLTLPSRWNPDHKRFYTPGSLLREFEEALEPNSYRVRHVRDNDYGYSYHIGPEHHAATTGSYEIELVIQKIARPTWTLT